ncbi:hypothetical protein IDSA_02175 [Pseudidiomarina salinarum]|uniref:Uncharacterized protein n=1 Tax=Pseudidiomarina salinarum TaxID=435908 RepID=A0A094IWP4_9GAMM|nr:hypothetical protein IDSA_02175 [Pseudidiomarina salinarum]RUO70697.1 hypothetical protein CWI79_04395 [Pseudidiomarina salinarum]
MLSVPAAAVSWPFAEISPWQLELAVVKNLQCPRPDAVQVWLPAKAGAVPAMRLFADWHRHPLAASQSCFTTRFYYPENLSCETRGERERLHCQLPLLPYEASVRQLVFVDEPGVASADDYQINVPLDASRALVAHEIGHWLGLADEYQMSSELAESFCNGGYAHASLNVVVSDTAVMSAAELEAFWQQLPWRFAVSDWQQLGERQADGDWRLGSADKERAGLFRIPACDASGKYAWRPVAQLTAMHYHDTAVWPELYLELIKRHQ